MTKSAHILLVEDNEGDILLTTEALTENKIVNKVSVVKNGSDAIDFMFKEGEFADAETPDLVLLDVNLPRRSGHEVLQRVKNDDRTKHIPIIMLTTSSSQRDIDLSYANHANCYITKPVEADEFLNAVASIEDFWLEIVSLSKNKKK
ncbi:MAG: response regulator [Balneolia bacterium]|nr:response regulator [Balneolia bacterium]